MSLEAIEKVSQAETKNRERKAAAEAEAKQIIADAEREGLALLQQARADAEQEGKALLHEAEERAAARAEEISRAGSAAGCRAPLGAGGGVYCGKGCEALIWPL